MELVTDPVASTLAATATGASGPGRAGFAALDSQDFLHLMIVQLQNQDPLAPAGNQELMQQFSTIREIEMSTTLVDTIRTLADQQSSVTATLQSLNAQQRFADTSSLIGRYVRGSAPDPVTGQAVVEGLVRAVRFGDHGDAILELTGGRTMSVSQVTDVTDLAGLIGAAVEFVTVGPDGSVERGLGEIRGVLIDKGQVTLEIDVGELLPKRVPLDDVVTIHSTLAIDPDESGAPSA